MYDPQSGLITAIAGNGLAGNSVDGIKAKQTSFSAVGSIALSKSDEIYLVEVGACKIKKLKRNGRLETIAGTGSSGYSGDGGLAINAKIYPGSGDLVVTNEGHVIFADAGNHRIRKIFANGTIVTIAGTGTIGYSGDYGLATNAQFDSPVGVAVSPSTGDIIVLDTLNHRIRQIFTNGTIVTIAGDGIGGYSGNSGWAYLARVKGPSNGKFKSNGDFVFADTNNQRIRAISANGTMSLLAGTDWLLRRWRMCFIGNI